MCREVIIIGAGGHGKVIADIVEKSGDIVAGFLDDNFNELEMMSHPFLGKIEEIYKYKDKEFIIAIGNNAMRKSVADKYIGIKFYTAIHPSAIIANDVRLGEGTCVMAGVVINSSTKIGRHCIVNSHSVVEHDNIIEDFVHLSPGGVLCGTVSVGEGSHIGAGAVIRNNISIVKDTMVGVGAIVVKDINKAGVYIGVPAKEMQE